MPAAAVLFVHSSIVRAIAGSLLGATGSPIIQMVADHHRGLVYTLSENGTIEGYDLGARGDEFRLFGRSTISCVPCVGATLPAPLTCASLVVLWVVPVNCAASTPPSQRSCRWR